MASKAPEMRDVPPKIMDLRIAHQKSDESFNFQIALTPPGETTPIAQRLADHIYMEDHLPNDRSHDTAIGEFLARWGNLENAVETLFIQLAGCDHSTAYTILRGFQSSKQFRDTIFSLSTQKSSDSVIKTLESLLSRVGTLTQKRNIIVHGQWVLEVAMWRKKGNLHTKSNLLRESNPIDRRVSKNLGDLKNQEDRSRYCYSVKRIRSAGFDADALTDDLTKFMRHTLTPDLARHRS